MAHTITHVKFGITQKSITLCNRQWLKVIKFGLFILQRNRVMKGKFCFFAKKNYGYESCLQRSEMNLNDIQSMKICHKTLTGVIWRNECWCLLLIHIRVNKSSTGLFWRIREFYSDKICKSEYSLWHELKISSRVGRIRQELSRGEFWEVDDQKKMQLLGKQESDEHFIICFLISGATEL